MQDLGLALSNLVDTIRSIEWVDKVETEDKDRGSEKHRVTVLLGDSENKYAIGAIKSVTQAVVLRLDVKGTEAETLKLSRKTSDLDNYLMIDPRRGGNAQATRCTGWTVQEQTREGAILQSTIFIDVNL